MLHVVREWLGLSVSLPQNMSLVTSKSLSQSAVRSRQVCEVLLLVVKGTFPEPSIGRIYYHLDIRRGIDTMLVAGTPSEPWCHRAAALTYHGAIVSPVGPELNSRASADVVPLMWESGCLTVQENGRSSHHVDVVFSILIRVCKVNKSNA